MILMHAMDAPYPIPGIGIQRGDTMYHLLSDTPGAAGTRELLAFVRACGGREAWIQSAGTYREHFDIFGEFADMARALGAKPATNAEVAAVLTRKRGMQEDMRPAVAALTSRQKRAVWQLMQQQQGVTAAQIDERAGPHVATSAQRLLAGNLAGKQITMLLGTPQDSLGLAITRALAAAGAAVTLIFVGSAPAWSDEQQAFLAAQSVSLVTRLFLTAVDLQGADLLIDRLLPWEETAMPTATVAHAIEIVNAAQMPTLAIDAPSGLDADPDDHRRHTPWLKATATLALGVPLRGLTMTRAASVIGDLWLADVGIPRRLIKQVGARQGPIFAHGPLVRLEPVPLGDPTDEIVRWVVAE